MATEPASEVATASNHAVNRYDRMEWAGAFGDLGTLIPFVVAYIGVLKLDPFGVLFGFGVSMLVCGLYYKTPFPVQPMKAIGAVASIQAVQTAFVTPAAVYSAALATGAIWLLLGLSGLMARVARLVPASVVVGIVLGLGFGFMLQGIKMMQADWVIAIIGTAGTLQLMGNRTLPAMFVLLAFGAVVGGIQHPELLTRLGDASIGFRTPTFALTDITWNQVFVGVVFVGLAANPLDLGQCCDCRHGREQPPVSSRVRDRKPRRRIHRRDEPVQRHGRWRSDVPRRRRHGCSHCFRGPNRWFGRHSRRNAVGPGPVLQPLGGGSVPVVPDGCAGRGAFPCRRAVGGGQQRAASGAWRPCRCTRMRSAVHVERGRRFPDGHPPPPSQSAGTSEALASLALAAGRLGSMRMTVMRVREMRVAVSNRGVPVRMRMFGAGSNRSLVRMIVMFVTCTVLMFMAVLKRFVGMRVLVALRQMQPDASRHQCAGDDQRQRDRFAQHHNRQGSAYERRNREIGPRARRSQMAQTQDEQRQAGSIACKAQHATGSWIWPP